MHNALTELSRRVLFYFSRISDTFQQMQLFIKRSGICYSEGTG